MFKSTLFLFFVVFISCSSLEMKYGAKVKDKATSKTYDFSSDIYLKNSNKTLCWITGILYGGACWLNLAKPSDEDIKTTESIGKEYVSQIYGDQFEIISENVSKKSFDSGYNLRVTEDGNKDTIIYIKCNQEATCRDKAKKICVKGYSLIQNKDVVTGVKATHTYNSYTNQVYTNSNTIGFTEIAVKCKR